MREAISEFLYGKKVEETDTFVYATSLRLTSPNVIDELNQQKKILKEKGIELIPWDSIHLSEFLEEYPELIKTFFGLDWATLFNKLSTDNKNSLDNLPHSVKRIRISKQLNAPESYNASIPFRFEGPQCIDFLKGNWIQIPTLAQDIYEKLEHGESVSIQGDSATGKTVLVRLIGLFFEKGIVPRPENLNLLENEACKRLVLYFDFFREEIPDIKSALRDLIEIQNSHVFTKIPLLIIDNLHLGPPEISNMVSHLKGTTQFLFTARPTKNNGSSAINNSVQINTSSPIEEIAGISIEKRNIIDLDSNKNHFQEIMVRIIAQYDLNRDPNTFYARSPSESTSQENLWVTSFIGSIASDLQRSNKPSQSFYEILVNKSLFQQKFDELFQFRLTLYKRIIHETQDHRDADRLTDIKTLYRILAVFSQFEIWVDMGFLFGKTTLINWNEEDFIRDFLNFLVQIRDVYRRESNVLHNNPEYIIPHQKIALVIKNTLLDDPKYEAQLYQDFILRSRNFGEFMKKILDQTFFLHIPIVTYVHPNLVTSSITKESDDNIKEKISNYLRKMLSNICQSSEEEFLRQIREQPLDQVIKFLRYLIRTFTKNLEQAELQFGSEGIWRKILSIILLREYNPWDEEGFGFFVGLLDIIQLLAHLAHSDEKGQWPLYFLEKIYPVLQKNKIFLVKSVSSQRIEQILDRLYGFSNLLSNASNELEKYCYEWFYIALQEPLITEFDASFWTLNGKSQHIVIENLSKFISNDIPPFKQKSVKGIRLIREMAIQLFKIGIQFICLLEIIDIYVPFFMKYLNEEFSLSNLEKFFKISIEKLLELFKTKISLATLDDLRLFFEHLIVFSDFKSQDNWAPRIFGEEILERLGSDFFDRFCHLPFSDVVEKLFANHHEMLKADLQSSIEADKRYCKVHRNFFHSHKSWFLSRLSNETPETIRVILGHLDTLSFLFQIQSDDIIPSIINTIKRLIYSAEKIQDLTEAFLVPPIIFPLQQFPKLKETFSNKIEIALVAIDTFFSYESGKILEIFTKSDLPEILNFFDVTIGQFRVIENMTPQMFIDEGKKIPELFLRKLEALPEFSAFFLNSFYKKIILSIQKGNFTIFYDILTRYPFHQHLIPVLEKIQSDSTNFILATIPFKKIRSKLCDLIDLTEICMPYIIREDIFDGISVPLDKVAEILIQHTAFNGKSNAHRKALFEQFDENIIRFQFDNAFESNTIFQQNLIKFSQITIPSLFKKYRNNYLSNQFSSIISTTNILDLGLFLQLLDIIDSNLTFDIIKCNESLIQQKLQENIFFVPWILARFFPLIQKNRYIQLSLTKEFKNMVTKLNWPEADYFLIDYFFNAITSGQSLAFSLPIIKKMVKHNISDKRVLWEFLVSYLLTFPLVTIVNETLPRIYVFEEQTSRMTQVYHGKNYYLRLVNHVFRNFEFLKDFNSGAIQALSSTFESIKDYQQVLRPVLHKIMLLKARAIEKMLEKGKDLVSWQKNHLAFLSIILRILHLLNLYSKKVENNGKEIPEQNHTEEKIPHFLNFIDFQILPIISNDFFNLSINGGWILAFEQNLESMAQNYENLGFSTDIIINTKKIIQHFLEIVHSRFVSNPQFCESSLTDNASIGFPLITKILQFFETNENLGGFKQFWKDYERIIGQIITKSTPQELYVAMVQNLPLCLFQNIIRFYSQEVLQVILRINPIYWFSLQHKKNTTEATKQRIDALHRQFSVPLTKQFEKLRIDEFNLEPFSNTPIHQDPI